MWLLESIHLYSLIQQTIRERLFMCVWEKQTSRPALSVSSLFKNCWIPQLLSPSYSHLVEQVSSRYFRRGAKVIGVWSLRGLRYVICSLYLSSQDSPSIGGDSECWGASVPEHRPGLQPCLVLATSYHGVFWVHWVWVTQTNGMCSFFNFEDA